MKRSAALVFSILAGLAGASAPALAHDDAHDHATEKLGTVAFANSCSPAAQESFERGVAWLHSFGFISGEKAFREALDRDPDCAIATWGIATVLFGNPLAIGPAPEDAQRAIAMIERGRSIGAKTQRERDYIDAVAAYYDHFGERLQSARIRALSEAFEALAARYRDDDETQIFNAIYLTASQAPTEKTFARAMKAAAVLEVQFAKHPDHPGVAHYLIHSYDFPPVAQKGLAAALCYADIAPGAYHALHMPSHIFTRVGRWQESIDSNTRSEAVAKSEKIYSSALHALDYMVYADLQLARDADALAALEDARGISSPEIAGVYATIAIPARYAVERDQWSEAAALTDPPASKFPFADAMTFFARAIGLARSGNPAAAEPDLARLAAIGTGLKAAKNEYWATEVEAQRLGAAAWISFAAGKPDDALKLMHAAADLEDSSEKHAVSPGRILPARELLGDMLLEADRPTEALAAYETSLVNDPRRMRSFRGAARAALAAGNADKTRYYFGRMIEMADAASTRPDLAQARQYLAGK